MRNLDAGVPPRKLNYHICEKYKDIEQRIALVTDSKRSRISLYNATKGANATRETRMEVVAWIAVCKFKCKLEGGFVRDWIVRGEAEYPPTHPSTWVTYEGQDKLPSIDERVVPKDIDCHLPKDAEFDIESFRDELHKYGIIVYYFLCLLFHLLLFNKPLHLGSVRTLGTI